MSINFTSDIDGAASGIGITRITVGGKTINLSEVSGGENNNGIEVGTIVGGGTNSVTIPVASLKSNVLVYADTENIENVHATGYGLLAIIFLSSVASGQIYMNSNAGTVTSAGLNPTLSSKITVQFADNSIVVTTKASGSANEKFVSGHTYHWIAW